MVKEGAVTAEKSNKATARRTKKSMATPAVQTFFTLFTTPGKDENVCQYFPRTILRYAAMCSCLQEVLLWCGTACKILIADSARSYLHFGVDNTWRDKKRAVFLRSAKKKTACSQPLPIQRAFRTFPSLEIRSPGFPLRPVSFLTTASRKGKQTHKIFYSYDDGNGKQLLQLRK